MRVRRSSDSGLRQYSRIPSLRRARWCARFSGSLKYSFTRARCRARPSGVHEHEGLQNLLFLSKLFPQVGQTRSLLILHLHSVEQQAPAVEMELRPVFAQCLSPPGLISLPVLTSINSSFGPTAYFACLIISFRTRTAILPASAKVSSLPSLTIIKWIKRSPR